MGAIMNIELLRFLNQRARIRKDITHQEYSVLGILWASERIILMDDGGTLTVHYLELDIVPTDEEIE